MQSAGSSTGTGRRFAALLAFFRSESAGGAVLMAASLVALVWANSPFAAGYERLLEVPIGVSAGPLGYLRPLHIWVNDGLMALFFLLVALEIRREMTEGELASPARIAAPGLAAAGGVAVPAVIYVALNWSDPTALRGWAIPVATDIAFSLAVLSVLGQRVPVALKIFLTALAIIDDLIAILVIAIFYTSRLMYAPLALAGLLWLTLFGLGRAGVRSVGPYLLGGVLLWACLVRSGVHPTLAGVALAFAVPMDVRAGETTSPARRLERGLGWWVAFAVLPLFGLANAGLGFATLSWGSLLDPVTLGIAGGLVLGKQIGVFGTAMLAWRSGIARPPGQLTALELYGAALLCGIGFTMSLFIGDLAFRGQGREAEVKLAVFGASLLSAAAGLLVLSLAARRAAPVRRAAPPAERLGVSGPPR
ncbi:MAG: Na+/H+ antiporter NhaA [Acidisphaera sp.]|nr:Na+/H+ antiporter NhaA [Acidisphaera sp.]